jgi:hypothetical protein
VLLDELEGTMNNIGKSDVKCVIGDRIAKIGKNNTGYEHVIVKYGIGKINERGERFLDS